MQTSVPVSLKIIKAAICLHNFVLIFDEKGKREVKERLNRQSSSWSDQEVYPVIHQLSSSSGLQLANVIRENFADYFMNEGAVYFQWEKAANADF